MPNCGCRDTCQCIIRAGSENVTISGSGNPGSPYEITVETVTPTTLNKAAMDAAMGGDVSGLVPRVDGLETVTGLQQASVEQLLARMDTVTVFTNQADIFDSVVSGWTLSALSIVKHGRTVTLYFIGTRTAALASNTSGDIGNDVIGTLKARFRPQGTGTPLTSGGTGFMVAGWCTTNGGMSVSALPPNVGIPAGGAISLGGTWLSGTFASDD